LTESTSSRWPRALLAPLTILAWLAVAAVAAWLLSHVTRALLTLILGAVIAYALTPMVRVFSRFTPRVVAVAMAYLIGAGLVFGLIGLVAVTASGQVHRLLTSLPSDTGRLNAIQPEVMGFLRPWGLTQSQLNSTETALVHSLQASGAQLAGGAPGALVTTASTILDVILILILSIYLTANGPAIGRWLRREAPAGDHRRRVTNLVLIVNQVVGGYVRGTLTMALLVGTLVGVGMAVMGVHYAVLLGVLAFFMEFVPILGVLISGVLCVSIALFQGLVLALVVLGYFVVVHVIEGDVVGPRVMGRAIGIHPAVALVALVAGTELFGIWGALFGAPLAGLLQAIATVIWTEYKGTAAAAPPPVEVNPALVLNAAAGPAHPRSKESGRARPGEPARRRPR